MGTRIHKVMGYGLKADKRKVRSIESKLDAAKPDALEAIMKRAYDAADSRISMKLGFDTKYPDFKNYPNLNDVIHLAFHPDDEKGHVVLVPPSCVRSWYRFNNDIDHIECFMKHQDCRDDFMELEFPLYPYLHWMDPVTGEELKHYSNIGDRKSYISEHGHAPVPMPPESVKVLANHFKLNWMKMRPCIATWWC
jgi:hypothetical protein